MKHYLDYTSRQKFKFMYRYARATRGINPMLVHDLLNDRRMIENDKQVFEFMQRNINLITDNYGRRL